MNYYEPRQHNEGGWHNTRMNDGRIWPEGYCREHPPHPSRDEAYECYRSYLLDSARFDVRMVDQQLRCEVCEVFTDRMAEIGPGLMQSHVPMCRPQQPRRSGAGDERRQLGVLVLATE